MDKTEIFIRLIEAILRNRPNLNAKTAAKEAKKAVEVIFR